MQIQTRVSTQIILSQAEIEQAIVAFIKASGSVSTTDDTKFTIEFEDAIKGGDLNAIIDVDVVVRQDDGETQAAAPATEASKAPRSPRKTAADKATAATPAEPEAEAPKPADPPFTTEPAANPAGNAALNSSGGLSGGGTQEPAEPQATPASTTPKIFPEKNTSAPPKPAEPEIDPAVKAKSLFANLSKPTN